MPTPRALRPSRAARVLLAAIAALALVATSCGDDEDPSERADTIEETTSTTTGSSSGDAADDTDAPEEQDDPAVVAQLEEQLLEVADLPTGWSAEPDDGEDDESDEDADGDSDMAEDCGVEGSLLPDDIEPLAQVERQFVKGMVGPFLFTGLARYAEGDAETALDRFDEMVQQCREFSSTDEDGVETSGTMQPVSFPSFGDQSFAARLTIESEGMAGQGDLVAVRQGDELLLMMGLSMTTMFGDAPFEDGEYEQLVTAATQKAFG